APPNGAAKVILSPPPPPLPSIPAREENEVNATGLWHGPMTESDQAEHDKFDAENLAVMGPEAFAAERQSELDEAAAEGQAELLSLVRRFGPDGAVTAYLSEQLYYSDQE